MAARNDPANHATRMDRLADLVAEDVNVNEAGNRLGLTRGQTARAWANIKKALGAQAR